MCAHCLKNVEVVGIDPDDVDAGNVDIDVVGHLLAVHLRAEHRILKHQSSGTMPARRISRRP